MLTSSVLARVAKNSCGVNAKRKLLQSASSFLSHSQSVLGVYPAACGAPFRRVCIPSLWRHLDPRVRPRQRTRVATRRLTHTQPLAGVTLQLSKSEPLLTDLQLVSGGKPLLLQRP